MSFKIDTVDPSEYQEVLHVWEASVRATHDFLKEEDIQYFKPLILNNYLDAVELRCMRNAENEIIGFSGTAAPQLEMLFIHPEYFGQGIGKKLLEYSVDQLNVAEVDVNEDNRQALDFYKHCGFEVTGRSATDNSGKPYPLLHMKLKNKGA